MTPTAGATLTNYWSFDHPGDPVIAADPFFGFPTEWAFTDDKAGLHLIADGGGFPDPVFNPWQDTGPGIILDGENTFGGGRTYKAATGAWSSANSGVTIFGWFQVLPSFPMNLMSVEFLFNANPSIGIGWDTATGKFQFPLGTLVAPPSSVSSALRFLAFTFNNATGRQKLYFNGILIGTEINNGFLPGASPSTVLTILGGQGPLLIDEIGLSLQSEYSAAQILSLYNGGAGKTWPAVNS